MRRAARRDANHGEIVKALRAVGVAVHDLGAVGGGVSDLLCFRPSSGLLRLLEVKAAKGKLTKAQVKFHQMFPAWTVRTVEEAFAAMDIDARQLPITLVVRP